MKILPLCVLASILHAAPASAVPRNDPRTPINAVNTPGDADSVYRITAPGSYYLEGSLVGVPGKAGIEIATTDVQIDLMGFVLFGQPTSLAAIHSDPQVLASSIVVRNGSISTWSTGIDLAIVSNAVCTDVSVRNVSGVGIRLGAESMVECCRVRATGGYGIEVSHASRVSECIVSVTELTGIVAASDSEVRACVVRDTFADAISGGPGTNVIECIVTNNQGGIVGGERAVIDGCKVTDSDGAGIRILSGTVRDCSVTSSKGHGIHLGNGGHVVGNEVVSSGLDGIHSLGATRIEKNHVRSHPGGAGIRTSGTGSFVVQNTLFANALQVSVPNAGNFVGPLVFVNSTNGRNEPWANLHGN